MNKEKQIYLEVELPSRTVEVTVTIEGYWDNNGIGYYEFGSEKCFDKGQDYFTIESHSWDKTGFSDLEISVIEEEISLNTKYWQNNYEEEEEEKEKVAFDYDAEDYVEN
jgi:hypothetical protein